MDVGKQNKVYQERNKHAGIRFCLLVISKQTQGAANISIVRQTLCNNSADISFAGRLWQVFCPVITGALNSLKAVLGDAVTRVMDAIDAHIECLFLQALQLDPKALKLEALEINDERHLCQ